MNQDQFRTKLSDLIQQALDAGLEADEIHSDLDGQKMMLDEISVGSNDDPDQEAL